MAPKEDRNCREQLARCKAELERCNRESEQLVGLLREGFELLRTNRAVLVIISEREPDLAHDVQAAIRDIDAFLNRQFQATLIQSFEGHSFVGSCEQKLLQCQNNANFCQQNVTTIREQFFQPMISRLREAGFITAALAEDVPGLRELRRRAAEFARRLQRIMQQ